MKDVRLNNIIRYKGKLAQVIGEIFCSRAVIIEFLEEATCPHCSGKIGKKTAFHVVSSSNFQENAESVDTLVSDPNIIIK